MMRHLRNGTTLPTVILGDWVMHNGAVLYGCVQNYWRDLIACKGQGISPFVMLFPALVDCWLTFVVCVFDETYFMTKKYAYMWDMQETRRTNFRRHTRGNSHKNDIFLYAYKNIHVYTNFRRHPLFCIGALIVISSVIRWFLLVKCISVSNEDRADNIAWDTEASYTKFK